MDSPTALAMLKCAIYNVGTEYIYVGKNLAEEQVERCFAYELYHQWRVFLDVFFKAHPGHRVVYLNGEIPKNFHTKEYFYPDMVLHSGQDNTERQYLACEIKRASNNDGILKDLYKLSQYLELLKKGDVNAPANYDCAAFIIIGSGMEEMKDAIKKSMERSPHSNLKEHDKSDEREEYINCVKTCDKLDRIHCFAVSVEAISDSDVESGCPDGKKIKIEECKLSDIIKK